MMQVLLMIRLVIRGKIQLLLNYGNIGFLAAAYTPFCICLLGTALRRSFKDHCLKKFEDCKIVMPVQGATWEIGVLQVFAQGIELFYKEPRSSVIGKLNSYVLHPSEVDQIPFFYCPAPEKDSRKRLRMEHRIGKNSKPKFKQIKAFSS